MKEEIYDIAGIGIGPFNLGMAALTSELKNLKTIFFDTKHEFNWHRGMMIEGTRLQVPFFADLVTPVSPCSTFSYINYLYVHQKLFRFAIRENYFIKRNEYNHYCRWVVAQLDNLNFNQQCELVHFDCKRNIYEIKTRSRQVYAKNVVLGVGTVPAKLICTNRIAHPLMLHSADYLFKKEQLLQQDKITLVGSGQSAAEIFFDLLKTFKGKLDWFTRAGGFDPMNYSKFALEKTSLDYTAHFYKLPAESKSSVLKNDSLLYKGINNELITEIYNLLDDGVDCNPRMHPFCDLINISEDLQLTFHHQRMEQNFFHDTNALIMATGYKTELPAFLNPIRNHINWDKSNCYLIAENYSVNDANTLFVLNGDYHSHGFNSADLGLGVYRNAIILNSILGYEHYKLERGITFQEFGVPDPQH